LPGFTNLRKLVLGIETLSDDDLVYLKPLHKLQELGLGPAAIRGPGLRNLQEHHELRYLSLIETLVDDNGLEAIQCMPQLEVLRLPYRTSDAGLKVVGKLTNLRELYLEGGDVDGVRAHVTDDGLKNLAGLTKLTKLSLSRKKGFTGAGLRYLKDAPLLELDLSKTEVNDQGLTALKQLKKLQRLRLNYTKVTDKVVAELLALPSLKFVELSEDNVSNTAMRKLRAARPALEVRRPWPF
jgi:hypothetical protein